MYSTGAGVAYTTGAGAMYSTTGAGGAPLFRLTRRPSKNFPNDFTIKLIHFCAWAILSQNGHGMWLLLFWTRSFKSCVTPHDGDMIWHDPVTTGLNSEEEADKCVLSAKKPVRHHAEASTGHNSPFKPNGERTLKDTSLPKRRKYVKYTSEATNKLSQNMYPLSNQVLQPRK